MADLGTRRINYTAASSTRPSNSFPGLRALISGSSPKIAGLYYDVTYDRSLDAPAVTTGSGLAAGPCTPFGVPSGTTTDNTQGIDHDGTKLHGGAPGAALTDGGFVALPGVKTSEGASCATIGDSSAAAGQNWISSFENVQCFDQLRVNAVLNQIAGKTHLGTPARIRACSG